MTSSSKIRLIFSGILQELPFVHFRIKKTDYVIHGSTVYEERI